MPTGHVWNGDGLALDPDDSVRAAERAVFERFAVEPSGRAFQASAHASSNQTATSPRSRRAAP